MSTVAQQNANSAAVVRSVFFLEMQFVSGTQRVSSMNMNYVWGGFTWSGIGALGNVDKIVEGGTLDSKALNFTLNAAVLTWIALAVGDVDDYRGRRVKLYGCPLDEAYRLIDTPELCWSGLMDLVSGSVEGEGDAAQGQIVLRGESASFGLKQRSSLRINAAQQKLRYPADTGLNYLTNLISQPQIWLTKKFQQQ